MDNLPISPALPLLRQAGGREAVVSELKAALCVLCEASAPEKRTPEYYQAVQRLEILVYGFDIGAEKAHDEFVKLLESRSQP